MRKLFKLQTVASFMILAALAMFITSCYKCKPQVKEHPMSEDEIILIVHRGSDTLTFLKNTTDTIRFYGYYFFRGRTSEQVFAADCAYGDAYEKASSNYYSDTINGKPIPLRITYSNYTKDFTYGFDNMLPFVISDFSNMFSIQVQGKTYYQVSKMLNHPTRDSTTDILYTDLQYGIIKIINGTNGAVYERILK